MALSFSTTTTSTSSNLTILASPLKPRFKLQSHPSLVVSVSLYNRNPRTLRFPCCHAAKQQSSSVEKRPPRKKRGSAGNDGLKGLSLDDVENEDDDSVDASSSKSKSKSQSYHPLPLPKPPAGFVVDEHGKVLMVSKKRMATIVDSTNNFPLDCIIRRVFRSSRGDECLLLCPVDTPVQILKSTNIDGWSAVSDEEVETILPTAAYALAKIHMHLVYSGFCYTARGGFCYREEDICEFRTDDGQDVDGLPTEGIEIACFHLVFDGFRVRVGSCRADTDVYSSDYDGSHYMIYTPSDPLLFVAMKDHNGLLQIADDDLLDDPAIISAIDEETEFNALVEEEAALLDPY